jgi:hypothetical protein
MTHRSLVLVHGRSQGGKDPAALKQEWLDALRSGFTAARLSLDLDEGAVTFPYYGDTLDALASRHRRDQVPDIVLRGDDGAADAEAEAFTADLLQQMALREGMPPELLLDDAQVRALGDHERLRRCVAWLDRRPGVTTAALTLGTADVMAYLRDTIVQKVIDDGAAEAFTPGRETVVVAHSLGSVVAYALLRERAVAEGWRVTELVTLGSPLGIARVHKLLRARRPPTRCPENVDVWFNARDPRDLIALYPVDAEHFPLRPAQPAVVHREDVTNDTDNRHGIVGYLRDPVVAARIHAALTN